MRKRIFISGPIAAGDRVENLAAALQAFRVLADHGFAPFCPHLSMFIAFSMPGIRYEDWMQIDLPWVEVADAVLRLPGESKGADQECQLALQRGLTVYHNLGRLIEKMGG